MGRPHWTSLNGDSAIWSYRNDGWLIGSSASLGTTSSSFYTESEADCVNGTMDWSFFNYLETKWEWAGEGGFVEGFTGI